VWNSGGGGGRAEKYDVKRPTLANGARMGHPEVPEKKKLQRSAEKGEKIKEADLRESASLDRYCCLATAIRDVNS
jgi:hypothetical protein